MVRKEKKAEIIDWAEDKLKNAEIIIATDYRGLTVAEISALRGKLREQGVEYHVIKNTLATFAAKAADKPDLAELLTGPTALVFGHEDVVQPAKILVEYKRAEKDSPLSIKGGLLADKLLTVEEITALAQLPPKEELIAKLVGLVQSPLYGLVNVLSGNLRGFVCVLQARAKQLEEGG